MKSSSIRDFIFLVAMLILPALPAAVRAAEFRAGASVQPISPTKFPAPVNGNMKGTFAIEVHDPMQTRCLAVSDGKTELVFCIVDACAIPRDICEKTKEIASRKIGVPAAQMLISATHTHSAAALTPAFQSDPDPDYVAALPNASRRGSFRRTPIWNRPRSAGGRGAIRRRSLIAAGW
jgi:hypothetical protein